MQYIYIYILILGNFTLRSGVLGICSFTLCIRTLATIQYSFLSSHTNHVSIDILPSQLVDSGQFIIIIPHATLRGLGTTLCVVYLVSMCLVLGYSYAILKNIRFAKKWQWAYT